MIKKVKNNLKTDTLEFGTFKEIVLENLKNKQINIVLSEKTNLLKIKNCQNLKINFLLKNKFIYFEKEQQVVNIIKKPYLFKINIFNSKNIDFLKKVEKKENDNFGYNNADYYFNYFDYTEDNNLKLDLKVMNSYNVNLSKDKFFIDKLFLYKTDFLKKNNFPIDLLKYVIKEEKENKIIFEKKNIENVKIFALKNNLTLEFIKENKILNLFLFGKDVKKIELKANKKITLNKVVIDSKTKNKLFLENIENINTIFSNKENTIIGEKNKLIKTAIIKGIQKGYFTNKKDEIIILSCKDIKLNLDYPVSVIEIRNSKVKLENNDIKIRNNFVLISKENSYLETKENILSFSLKNKNIENFYLQLDDFNFKEIYFNLDNKKIKINSLYIESLNKCLNIKMKKSLVFVENKNLSLFNINFLSNVFFINPKYLKLEFVKNSNIILNKKGTFEYTFSLSPENYLFILGTGKDIFFSNDTIKDIICYDENTFVKDIIKKFKLNENEKMRENIEKILLSGKNIEEIFKNIFNLIKRETKNNEKKILFFLTELFQKNGLNKKNFEKIKNLKIKEKEIEKIIYR